MIEYRRGQRRKGAKRRRRRRKQGFVFVVLLRGEKE